MDRAWLYLLPLLNPCIPGYSSQRCKFACRFGARFPVPDYTIGYGGEKGMPAIRSVSDLRNDNEVLKEVDQSGMVYLTRNGSGVYAIMSIREADEYERLKATHGLSVLDRAKRRAEREGWIDEEKNVKVMALS